MSMYKRNDVKTSKLGLLCLVATLIGVLAIVAAKFLLGGIAFFTHLFYFQEISFAEIEPAHAQLKIFHILVPVIGGLLIGFMARFLSSGIRGHGIPEVMEKILTEGSRIPRRMTFLKPLASALAIGTGGPFGAEGPIIATGSSLGSWMGRHFLFSEYDRKILLAAGAAAGMTAVFGTPLSAVFLCIELLLFEFSSKSFIPVIVAVSVSYSLRLLSGHTSAMFPLQHVHEVVGMNTLFYFCAGAATGVFACFVTKFVALSEHIFEKIPFHWMWWPAIGGLIVGVIGYFEPRSLGVGYSNISDALQGKLLLLPAVTLMIWKLVSWAAALGSGTAGGTLAPLLTLGSSFGVVLSYVGQHIFPELAISTEVTALICMGAMFSGATRAVLTSTVLALEATGGQFGIAPLLLANSASYLISLHFMEETLLTEKISKKGVHVPTDYFSVKVDKDS